MGIKEKSLKLAAITLIADEAKKAKDKLRAELQAEMDELGADRVKAELGDDVVAYVTTTKPKRKWIITNEKRWIEWVEVNCPDEIVKAVRESSVERILDKAFQFVEINTIIDWNGEQIEFLAYESSDPYLTTKFHSDGREALKNAIIGNVLDAKQMLELE